MATIYVKLPQMSMTMIEGVVTAWHKQLGDQIRGGEPLLEVETDKMVKDITAPQDGFLVKISAAEGDVVPINGVLCVISDQVAWTDAAPIAAAGDVATVKSEGQSIPAPQSKTRVRISPLAKVIAAHEGICYDTLVGTGPGGTIVKKDVLACCQQRCHPAPVHTPAGADLVLPFQGIRKRTAENMMLSRQNTASLTTYAEVNMSRVEQCREFVKASYTTFTVKAVANALREEHFQMMRGQLQEDGIHIRQDININVSVATGRALITPVISNADKKNMMTLSEEIKQVSQRGRDNQLQPEDMQGGCFTVTNSGVFGSLFYTPIINYPQAAIIGMGKTARVPVVDGDKIVIAPMMYLCLSYDHRLIDGEVGAPFLQRVKYYLEHPEELMR